ncbi:MAG: hypothetical protein INF93_01440 [Rhodobacter sp.]|jgi:beta-mannosidase|nr:hypothetical protein [Rhodobacter sp.]
MTDPSGLWTLANDCGRHSMPFARADCRAAGLATGHLAFFVAAYSDRPGRCSHNAFALLPGQDARITFIPEAPGAAPCFTLRHLHSATPGAPQPQEL